ncbi:Kinesin-like protein bimC [Neonectria ditissima]|uniref:Kinesin-like protein bimC n=1 Tax=Neonectria ditissima TaxID=78410 RepID=A0A0P7BTR4_9HYPO|nr:Kinesin-like protein bimC [Neonectria ditissima]
MCLWLKAAPAAVEGSRCSLQGRCLLHDKCVPNKYKTDQQWCPAPGRSVLGQGTKRKKRDFDSDEGGEGTNIRVVVRCRGRNEREVRENSAVAVNTDGVRGKQVELRMRADILNNKTYDFDRVFSQAADQSMVFDDTAKPILDERLAGYNCTIFAYGQTGTGKTYTMSGDMTDTLGILSDGAGIIPRVLQELFNKLGLGDTENCVKCSFIELYNEELRDLLSADDAPRLKLYDDASRRGHASTRVQGMEEKHIQNAIEGIKALQDGSSKRQVAATNYNDRSSPSHTIFTITAYVKQTNQHRIKDLVSTGKLNLVHLAGSENIQRSGAKNTHAAKAGIINKLLLTLGRVINALVDRSSHIPYRESKLTHLLQDSLGGQTKTCIIATVSPAKSNLEETMSTLDYAFRAKNIRNKPQLHSIPKNPLLKDLVGEIEKLKNELISTRQRNGVYLPNDMYEETVAQSESRRVAIQDQGAKMETLETNLRNKAHELFSLISSFTGLKKDHEGTKAQPAEIERALNQTEVTLSATRQHLAEEKHLRNEYQTTEEKLATIGDELIGKLRQTAAEDRQKLLTHISNLVGEQGDAQEARLVDQTVQVQKRLAESNRSLERAVLQYSQSMDVWGKKEGQLLEEARVSHHQLNAKLKDDCAKANELSACVQSAARSIHTKTAQAVDEQRSDLDMHVEALDGFVHRGKTESAASHEVHAQSVQALSGAVQQLFADMLGQVETSSDGVKKLGEEMETDAKELCKHMEPLEALVCEPLANLRKYVSETALQEYQHTGATPPKCRHQYPTRLPRTEVHSIVTCTIDDDAPQAAMADEDVYANDGPLALLRPAGTGTTSSSPRLSSISSVRDKNHLGLKLREVDPNVPMNLAISTTWSGLYPSTLPLTKRTTRSLSGGWD